MNIVDAISACCCGDSDNTTNLALRPWKPRNETEIDLLVNSWLNYVSNRAAAFWKDASNLRPVLKTIARLIDHNCDPVLGPESECVLWHGEITQATRVPIIHFVVPQSSNQTKVTYTTRFLAFLFANQQSFDILTGKPKEAFETICGDPSCISIHHISVKN